MPRLLSSLNADELAAFQDRTEWGRRPTDDEYDRMMAGVRWSDDASTRAPTKILPFTAA